VDRGKSNITEMLTAHRAMEL